MPFTPFHFGPGLFFKGLLLERFSLTVFIASQVIIDCETAWNIIRGNERWHTLFHTYLGSLIVVAALMVIGKHIYKISMTILKIIYKKSPLSGEINYSTIFISALIGAWSHVLFDSIMHQDTFPFLPFIQNNPTLGLVSLLTLHLGCIVSGGVGVFIWMDRIEKRQNPFDIN